MEFSIKACLLFDGISKLDVNSDNINNSNTNLNFNNLHIEANQQKITLWIESNYEEHLIFIEDNSVSVNEIGSVSVNRNKLKSLSKLFLKDSIISIHDEEGVLTIFDPKEELSLKISAESSSLKEYSDFDGETILSIQQRKLKQLIEVVLPFIGKNEFREYLNGALFKIENNSLKILGSDGTSLAIVETQLNQAAIGSKNYLISKFFLDELSSIINLDSDELVELKVFYKGVHTSVNNHSINSSLIMAEFPDIERQMNLSSLQSSLEFHVPPILDCLKIISSLSISSTCSLNFTENKLVISCNKDNDVSFRKEFLIKGNNQTSNLTLNLENLIKTLSHIRTDNVILKIYKDAPFFVEFSPTDFDEIKSRFILSKMKD